MKRLRKVLILAVLFMGTPFVGASYGSEIPALRDAKDPAERVRVQALIDGARREGKLDWPRANIYPEQADQIFAGFKEYYGLPRLELINTYVVGTELITRVEQLFKAGRTPPDVISTVAWDWFTALMKRGKLMRYESPYYKEYTFSHRAKLSMPGYWVSDAYTSNPVWNVTAVEKRGIKNFNPTSWWDFVDPKIIPLISMSNLATSTSGIPWGIGTRKVLDDEWFMKLGRGKPALYLKASQGETWLSSGEYPIGLTSRVRNAQALEEEGIKVRWVYPKEGIVLFPMTLVILADAPHPNTAKLFADYVRSAPGVDKVAEATTYSYIYGRPGVKVPEKEKKYEVPMEETKIIPLDWDKEVTVEAVNSFKAWAKKTGVGF